LVQILRIQERKSTCRLKEINYKSIQKRAVKRGGCATLFGIKEFRATIEQHCYVRMLLDEIGLDAPQAGFPLPSFTSSICCGASLGDIP
jgi:hypothetical protein